VLGCVGWVCVYVGLWVCEHVGLRVCGRVQGRYGGGGGTGIGESLGHGWLLVDLSKGTAINLNLTRTLLTTTLPPSQMNLLDRGIKMAAEAEEPEEMNFVRKHAMEQVRWLWIDVWMDGWVNGLGWVGLSGGIYLPLCVSLTCTPTRPAIFPTHTLQPPNPHQQNPNNTKQNNHKK
jgi:hypothetical protein